jgi:hypothetical protein
MGMYIHAHSFFSKDIEMYSFDYKLGLVAGALCGSTAVVLGAVVVNFFTVKKARQNRMETERAWLQMVADRLKDPNNPLSEEMMDKLWAIIRPLQKQGLLT